MKWLPSNGSTQQTSDGRYLIMQANSKNWIAYYAPRNGPTEQIGERSSDIAARKCCEEHEARLRAA